MKLLRVVPLILMTALMPETHVAARQVTGISEGSQTAMMQVVLHLRRESNTKELLRQMQAQIQRIDHVRQVTVSYTARELSVRYLGMESGKDRVFSRIYQEVSGGDWQVGQPEVAPLDRAHPRKLIQGNLGISPFKNADIQCLHDEMAHILCEKHLSASTLDSLDLDKCYVFKIDVEATADSSDISARAALEGENGEMVRPLHWFQLPSSASQKASGPPNVSGLLIFPRIPLAGVGLTLRLLRANGDGYDSYTVEVPKR